MMQIPVFSPHLLEVGMVVKVGRWLVKIEFFPGDEFEHEGQLISNKFRNKWFCTVLKPKKEAKKLNGNLQLVCFDLHFGDSVKVFRLEPEERWPLTNLKQRFISLSA